MALGLLLNVSSPNVQIKYHTELFTMFLQMMANEEMIKLKS